MKHRVLTSGGVFIAEGDLFRLIVKSQISAVKYFERCAFDEVLHMIRKNGMYARGKKKRHKE